MAVHMNGGAKPIPTTVHQEDIWGPSSFQGVVQVGDQLLPSQTTPAEPGDPGFEPKIGPHGLPGSLFPTPDVAAPNDPYPCSCVHYRKLQN